jgi:uncharacterized damage-inducible protein DinB
MQFPLNQFALISTMRISRTSTWRIAMSDLKSAIDQIRTARMYTKDLLKHVDDSDWFRQPAEGVTHVAWQVGHLAVCEYGLALKRIRGAKPEDSELFADEYRTLFGKGSSPASDPGRYPAIADIREVLDRVHEQAIEELSALPEETFEEPTGDPPHLMFKTKLGALHWCAQHEFIHAGQIALLRRLFGAEPLR